MLTENPKSRYDLMVVGGGLVGASFAWALARRLGGRVPVLVVEAGAMVGGAGGTKGAASAVAGSAGGAGAALPADFDARSTALSLGSARLLQGLDLWDEVAPYASGIREIRVSDLGRFGGTRLRASEQGTPALGYVVENRHLAKVLHGRLLDAEHVHVAAPMRVKGIQPVASGMRVVLQGGGAGGAGAEQGGDAETQAASAMEVEAGLVVLADGGKSPVCAQLGISHSRQDYGQHALAANINFERAHNGVAFERFTHTGPLAVLPLPSLADNGSEPRGSLVWSLAPQQAAEYMTMPAAELLPLLQAQFGQQLGRITHIGSRSCYPLALSRAREQVRPGLVLLGNAAHNLHPVAGQGLNLSLRDSAALVETLAAAAEATEGRCGEGLGEMPVLQTYLQRRAADQEGIIRATDGIVRLFSGLHPAQALLRRGGLLALDLLPALRRRFALQAMGMR